LRDLGAADDHRRVIGQQTNDTAETEVGGLTMRAMRSC
jgi:hypothetical protein